MMFNTILFPALFLFLTLVLLWIIIGCKGNWIGKFWLINISCCFVFIVWSSVFSYMGWGVPYALPEKFRLLGYYSDEPKSLYVLTEKESANKFNIKNIFEYRSDDNVRLYKLPYNKKFHSQLEAAMEKVQRGAYVFGSKTRVMEAEEVNGMQNDENMGPTRHDAEHHFYVLPPARMFTKPQP